MRAGYASAPHKHNAAPERKGVRQRVAVLGQDLWSVASIDARPLLLAFSMVAGAAAYFLLPSEPPAWAAGVLVCAAAASLWLARRWLLPGLVETAGWILLGIALGAGAGVTRTALVSSPVIPAETAPLMLEGWLSEVEPGAKGPRLRIDVHAVSGLSPEQTPKVVRVTHRLGLEVSPGRFVRCRAVLRPPPAPAMPDEYDFQRQAWFEQLGAVGYVQGRCQGGSLGAPRGWLEQAGIEVAAFRRRLAEHVAVASGDRAGGFAAALVSGDRSFMPIADQEALRNSGLAHLLAISGLHMAIVGGLVFALVRGALALVEPLALRVPVQKPAALVALLASLCYLVVSGAGVSTQRAFIMSAVVFGAVLFDRAALSLRSFAIAMILVVLLQPESVMTPGFQMSFAATGALIATYEAWTARRAQAERVMGPVSRSWASLAVTSLVAGTATAPFALYHFNRLAGLGLLANLAAMPVITFVSGPLAALALILTPFGLGDVGLRWFGYSLEIILNIAQLASGAAPSAIAPASQMPGSALAFFSLALALAVVAKGRARILLSGLACLPAAWLWMSAPGFVVHLSPSGEVFIRQAGGQVVRIAYADGDGLSPLRFSTVAETGACTGWPCRIESVAGPVILADPDIGKPVCLPAPHAAAETRKPALPADAGCVRSLGWRTVVAGGGVTLYANGRLKSGTDGCGRRPWRPCR